MCHSFRVRKQSVSEILTRVCFLSTLQARVMVDDIGGNSASMLVRTLPRLAWCMRTWARNHRRGSEQVTSARRARKE